MFNSTSMQATWIFKFLLLIFNSWPCLSVANFTDCKLLATWNHWMAWSSRPDTSIPGWCCVLEDGGVSCNSLGRVVGISVDNLGLFGSYSRLNCSPPLPFFLFEGKEGALFFLTFYLTEIPPWFNQLDDLRALSARKNFL